MTNPHPFSRARRAFTILELMVACAVFAVLSMVLLQVFGSVTATTDASQARSEILRQAIGALERVNCDIARIVRSGKWNLLVLKNTDSVGNDALVFLAPVASAKQPADPRQLSLVRYGIAERDSASPAFGDWPEMPAFARTVHAFGWNEDLEAALPFTESSANAALAGASSQQIAPGVIRYEICFQLWDGSLVAEKPDDPAQIRALVCGVVAVDSKALVRLTDAQRDQLASHFPKARAGERPAEAWEGVLENLPPAARQTVRIYEQTISI